ncbi:hypothetical protein DVU_2065 [Nitratidesulfovibrio vulgaris str. Hildenborough]|uniref:Uncharacterized protein n=1 Tax=Nitratidesulfovibrio vulgaris (strain ATCC 29579 / DSM 644 / CCUG 34227 / NCIMB 8303 / VKM B-1760 / Hildenborough) TaxID=882 RepID=Q72AD2_NITV2|nr:hypothetical protein DVU_2065 [Nitratidesulfovibrio vulgaris str. Hildenborough]
MEVRASPLLVSVSSPRCMIRGCAGRLVSVPQSLWQLNGGPRLPRVVSPISPCGLMNAKGRVSPAFMFSE